MNMRTLGLAIQQLAPDRPFRIVSFDPPVVRFVDQQPGPTSEELMALIPILEQQLTATEYQRRRAAEYPNIGDQLDDLFHAGAFSPEMQTKLQAIKSKYPKPG